MKLLVLTVLGLGLSFSAVLAQEKMFDQICTIESDGTTYSVKMFYTDTFKGVESLTSVKIQPQKKLENGDLEPAGNELTFPMKIVLNFHKGAVYEVELNWEETQNPGALFYDSGSTVISLAFYRTVDGSVSGTGRCR